MIYFDTDVIIHSIIIQSDEKHRQAIALIEEAIESGFWISPDLLKAIHTKILNK